ncbi:hypothetical protein [Actinomadura alba]|uniref:Uncharacterized protein n=1 Tax=Actinomadura alba TaxID=406431 RepID=A0ABR7LRM0_9ACTN|nr:hypothetical protein [Actinomadura alba]MBC6467497.1 hypothetical protein [Actinomadura alba]
MSNGFRSGRCLPADLLTWLREVVPELPEPVLPNGQPVASGSIVERYGYNATGTDR